MTWTLPLSPRALQAAELWHEGLTGREIAKRLGISPSRASQLLRKAGIVCRVTSEQIIASIRKSQSQGLIHRKAIIAHVCTELRVSHARACRVMTSLMGNQWQYVPPPGTPDGWRYCSRCEAFAPPSSRHGYCQTHYNTHMREMSMSARRAAGILPRKEQVAVRAAQQKARSRKRVASVAHLSAKEAAALLGVSKSHVETLRWMYGRDGRKGV